MHVLDLVDGAGLYFLVIAVPPASRRLDLVPHQDPDLHPGVSLECITPHWTEGKAYSLSS